MKSRKITTIGVTIAVLLCIGGCIVKHKDDTKQGKTIAASSTKGLKEDEETIMKKQLAYLKEHEQEIVAFLKAQSSKVESVQIYWDETEWGVAGNGTPQGGDEMILIFGGFNQNPESSWRVDVVVKDGQINLKTISLGQYLRIGGRIFE
ncbi:hypothetical protein [Streptococcus parasanguinis]|uniref:hypothetical protein n=1 Tax=Streptococcus parasanguinis TaxID=1318 RepID=UPI0004E210BB|nr:hypothetical protein [Streptococcus parasanguinis]KJU89242.1 hypothetical protein TZ97_00954 [Streptococcus parasanguinis]MBZ2091749.1 lipoprotein BUG3 [Streptococcus parasanguinis]